MEKQEFNPFVQDPRISDDSFHFGRSCFLGAPVSASPLTLSHRICKLEAERREKISLRLCFYAKLCIVADLPPSFLVIATSVPSDLDPCRPSREKERSTLVHPRKEGLKNKHLKKRSGFGKEIFCGISKALSSLPRISDINFVACP